MSAHPTAVLLALHGATPKRFNLAGLDGVQWRILSCDRRRVLWYLPSGPTWLIGSSLAQGTAYADAAWDDIPDGLLDQIPQRTLDHFVS